jgi:hypothetical protein|tara:strand:- start:468 stop:980 length:513 start_codon:yes stop_codon:yes gene_type:complete
MAVNNIEQRFEAPIAGMAMTHEVGARPWQQPAQYTSVEEALQYYLPRMQDDAFTDSLINVIEMGMPLTTLANTIQLAGVMDGRHNIDVGILIMPVLIEMMQLVAEAEGVKYVTGMERNIEGETKDSDVSAALATLKDDLGNNDMDEQETQEMDIVEEQDEPSMGLMARRS